MTTQNVKLGVAWLLLAAVLGCDSGATVSPAAPPSGEPGAATPPQTTVQTTGEPAPKLVLPGLQECLTTPDGLRRKVITSKPGLRCLTEIPNGRLTGEALGLFEELFVLDAIPESGPPEWFLVSRSPRGSDKIGYLRAETVAVWNTRIALRPIAPVLFYSAASDAEEMALRGRTSGEPIGRAAPDTERKYLPWPIVSSSTVVSKKGELLEVALVSFLGELKTGDAELPLTTRYSAARKQAISDEVAVLTAAFCLDNTKSTGRFVPEIIRFISDSSAALSEQRKNIKFALTLYRDDVPGLTWDGAVTKTLWDGAPQSFDGFLKKIRPISAPVVGSKGASECGFQGLKKIIEKTKFPPLSHRVVIWISDNSCHKKGSLHNPSVGPDDIIQAAGEANIVIHSVAIRGGGGAAEQALHFAQCRAIADGTGGQVYCLEDATQIATEISAAVGREKAVIRKNSSDLDKISSGELSARDYMATGNRDVLRRRYQFVRLLSRAGVDLAGFEPDTPTFAQAWVPTQLPGGESLFERMVWVSRVELDVLLAELNDLVALLRTDSTKGLTHLYGAGVGGRVGFSKRRNGDIPFDIWAAARGLPMRTGITMKTRTELFAMSPEEKLLLKARLINKIIPRLTNARSSRAFRLTGDFDFAFLPENVLP